MSLTTKTVNALAIACADPGAALDIANRLNMGGLAAARPTTPAAGQIYYSTDTGVWEVYDGTDWVTSTAAGPQIAMDLDPTIDANHILDYGALFPGGDNANYLSVADHADFDFATSGKFSVAFTLNRTTRIDLSNGVNMTILGQNRDAANSGGWWISTGGSNNTAIDMYLWLATNSDGNTGLVNVGFTDDDPDHDVGAAQYVFTYDTAVVTAAERCVIYRNGIAMPQGSYTILGTLPATLLNPSVPPFSIGREGHSAHDDYEGIVSKVRLWKGRVLTAGDVTELWNFGNLKNYADLSAGLKTSCVGGWDLGNNAGALSLADSSTGAHTLTATGTVTQATVVLEHWDTKGRFRFKPIAYNAAGVYKELSWYHAPRISTINGVQAYKFTYNHNTYCPVLQCFDSVTADFIYVVVWDEIALDGEKFTHLSASELDELHYFLLGYNYAESKHKPRMRIKNATTGPADNYIHADFDFLNATPYVVNWRCLGTGDAASYECRVNGTQLGGFTFGIEPSAYNKGPGSSTTRMNLSLGGLTRQEGPSHGLLNCHIGRTVVCTPGCTTAQNRAIEAELAAQYGITLAS